MLGSLDAPSSGSMWLNGNEIGGQKERDLVKLRRENIGFVFQQFYLMPTPTAREGLELPLLFSKNNSIKKRIDKILRMMRLVGRGDHLPRQLSSGELQRAAIGRSLINDPKIILADEPTRNPDSATSEMIYRHFSELSKKGLTLAVAHNLFLASRAKRMYIL